MSSKAVEVHNSSPLAEQRKSPKLPLVSLLFFPGPKSLAYLGRKQVRPWARARSSDPPFANLERVRGVGFIADLP